MNPLKLLHPLRRQRGQQYGVAGLGCSANLYDLYLRRPRAVLPHISEVSCFFDDNPPELAHWNEANAVAGLKSEIRWLSGSKPVIEVRDLTENPAWVIYPVDEEWQVDEFDGTSHRASSLGQALQIIMEF